MPRFGLRSILVLVLLVGAALAAFQHMQLRREHQELLKRSSLQEQAIERYLVIITAHRAVMHKNGLADEVEEAYQSELKRKGMEPELWPE